MQVTDLSKDPLAQIMRKAKLEMPFSDFEETVMHRIQQSAIQQSFFSRDRKLSFIFFLLGTTLGLVINFILGKTKYTLLNISPPTILLIFQLGFVLLFLIQLEKNLHLFEGWKKLRQRT